MKNIADMIAEAIAQVYGAEWEKMTAEQQRRMIMGFIETAAKKEGMKFEK